MRRSTQAAIATLLGCGLAVGGAEHWASEQPVPRVQQLLELDSNGLTYVDGVPTWHSSHQHEERWNLDCIEDGQADVVILGSSIFHGVRLQAAETLGPQLASLLATGEASPCIVNLAQPGSAFPNQRASLLQHSDTLRPKLVIWEMWHNSVNQFQVVGEAAYNFGSMRLDSQGLPNTWGLPAGLNRALFSSSHLYRFFDLKLAKKGSRKQLDVWGQFVEGPLASAVDELRAQGIAVLLVFTPQLSKPFSDQTLEFKPTYSLVSDWAKEHDVRFVDLAVVLAGTDPVSVRLDPCCHYNAAGTRRVAQALAGPVGEMLD